MLLFIINNNNINIHKMSTSLTTTTTAMSNPFIYKHDKIQMLLSKKLSKDNTLNRQGSGNAKFTYIESWKVIQLANQIFGYNGWSCSILDCTADYCEQDAQGKYSVGISATVKVTLTNGASHEDIGFGSSENQGKKGAAIEKAKKEAISDARKRALRCFGDALGNSLYDKAHLKRISSKNGNTGDDLLQNTMIDEMNNFHSIKEEHRVNNK